MDNRKFTSALDKNNLTKFQNDINRGFYIIIFKRWDPITTILKGETQLPHKISDFFDNYTERTHSK